MPQATTRISSGMTLLLGVFLASLFNGCAVHYYDQATGTEHLWGIGQMKMRAIQNAEGLQAVAKGVTVVGVKVGSGLENYSIGAGYDAGYRILIHGTNTAIRYEAPRVNGFNFRVGTKPPFASSSETTHIQATNQSQ